MRETTEKRRRVTNRLEKKACCDGWQLWEASKRSEADESKNKREHKSISKGKLIQERDGTEDPQQKRDQQKKRRG